ncbi:hypothetical protein GDO81_006554 [Engystomops pustulosus]|uniref:Uncharacterized protein n=1 Tax=Engystomops pustulosus TaxID=76066 RepID=A0AAV7CXJ9_ENGPU|nr:hypothetical protein GDO81_006554 [Engystomops pustulosus]
MFASRKIRVCNTMRIQGYQLIRYYFEENIYRRIISQRCILFRFWFQIRKGSFPHRSLTFLKKCLKIVKVWHVRFCEA